MGSAVRKSSAMPAVLARFAEFQRHALSEATAGLPGRAPVAADIAALIDDPATRHQVLMALADFIVLSFQTGAPDLRFWQPPE